MDLKKKRCETCADEDCKRLRFGLDGFLKGEYCVANNYALWKPKQEDQKGETK